MSPRSLRSGEVSVELEVPFYDLDPLRIVWHGNYLKYMERARTELFRACDLDMETISDLGFRFYIVDVRCRYISPLCYGDRFRVTARFADVENRMLVAHEIYNFTRERRAARGRSVVVTTSREGDLLLKTPDAIRSRLPI
jgi:acyl-CoA thioester hydrolase